MPAIEALEKTSDVNGKLKTVQNVGLYKGLTRKKIFN